MGKYILLLHLSFCLLISIVSAQENKNTIAVQALFQEEIILDSLRFKATSYDSISSARSHGARPHMTIASFKLTKQEITEFSNAFALLNTRYPSHKFNVKLEAETRDSSKWSYYLVPVIEDKLLINIHDSLYTKLDKGYEKKRKIDMPGYWWPHISMFTIHATSPKLPDDLLKELEKIRFVTLKGFALVRFGPINYFEEIETYVE